ncbi:MAG: LptF/LptG family permease [Flavobacteriales bacterium]
MTRLDKYIIGKFLKTFFFMLGVFCVVAVIFDLVENIGRLLENEAPFWQTVKYYFSFIFFFANMLSGFIVFLTIIWFTSKLAQKTEIIAMLSGGMPFRRFLRPYFIAASLLVAISLILTHFIVPAANKSKVEFEVEWIHVNFHVKDQNLYREITPGTIAYFRSITYSRATGYRFQLERWDEEESRLEQRIVAAKGTWMSEDSLWRLVNVSVRDFNDDGTESFRFVNRLDTALTMRIEDFAQRAAVVNTMPTTELIRYIDQVRFSGADVCSLELTRHSRTSTPFAIFVLTFLGVGIASRKQRGGVGIHLFFAVLVGFTFVFASRMISVFAATASPPEFLPVSVSGIQFIAAWLPNVLFTALGFWIYYKAPK